MFDDKDIELESSVQDEGRTLKLTINNRKPLISNKTNHSDIDLHNAIDYLDKQLNSIKGIE